jgi:hypothetical protein
LQFWEMSLMQLYTALLYLFVIIPPPIIANVAPLLLKLNKPLCFPSLKLFGLCLVNSYRLYRWVYLNLNFAQ